MDKKNIAIVGANGKMGSLLYSRLYTKYNVIKITEDYPLINIDLKKFPLDIVVDFANANSSVISAKYCYENNIPILVASTGQSKEEIEKMKSYSIKIPIMICPNLSIGICLIKKMIEQIVSKENFDITIHEKHHKEKKDKPSGTALLLKNFILSCNDKQNIDISSERGGKEIGTHIINFYFKNELISISHKAFSRDAFLDGAEMAIEFLLKQTSPHLYNFDNIIQF